MRSIFAASACVGVVLVIRPTRRIIENTPPFFPWAATAAQETRKILPEIIDFRKSFSHQLFCDRTRGKEEEKFAISGSIYLSCLCSKTIFVVAIVIVPYANPPHFALVLQRHSRQPAHLPTGPPARAAPINLFSDHDSGEVVYGATMQQARPPARPRLFQQGSKNELLENSIQLLQEPLVRCGQGTAASCMPPLYSHTSRTICGPLYSI
jgi:hypothetical protein